MAAHQEGVPERLGILVSLVVSPDWPLLLLSVILITLGSGEAVFEYFFTVEWVNLLQMG